MNNIIVLPMIIPLLTGIILIFLRKFIRTQRWVSIGSIIVTACISVIILNRIQTDGLLRLDFSGWKPPFGILSVADSFAMLLVLTSSIVTAGCLLSSFTALNPPSENTFVYPFAFLLAAGVHASFLTGV